MSALSARLKNPWRRPRVGLAFSSEALLGLRRDGNFRVIRRDMPPGLLVPNALTPNIQSVSDVARLASEIVLELSLRGARAAVVVPDLAVVSGVFPAAKAETDRDLAAELAGRLAFSVSEARTDFWRGAKGETLGAAARDTVVRQYEQVVEAADCRLGWIDAASLVRIPVWAAASASEPRAALVRAQLYRSHYVLAVFRGGELVDVRTRLRSGDDADVVAEEIQRLSVNYDLPSLGAVTLSGEGASACAERLRNVIPTSRVSVEDEGEERQLEASLSALVERA